MVRMAKSKNMLEIMPEHHSSGIEVLASAPDAGTSSNQRLGRRWLSATAVVRMAKGESLNRISDRPGASYDGTRTSWRPSTSRSAQAISGHSAQRANNETRYHNFPGVRLWRRLGSFGKCSGPERVRLEQAQASYMKKDQQLTRHPARPVRVDPELR